VTQTTWPIYTTRGRAENGKETTRTIAPSPIFGTVAPVTAVQNVQRFVNLKNKSDWKLQLQLQPKNKGEFPP
jgi:hypothetical protein